MRRLFIFCIVWVALFATAVAVAQVTKSKPVRLTMSMVMTSRELQETGVASLSLSQRKALDAWLNRYTMRVLAFASTARNASKSSPKRNVYSVGGDNCNPVIESQIDGDFNGWDDDTIFKLTNGEIWEQVEYDYEYEYAYMPDVIIYPTNQGCRLKVSGMDDTVSVRRIK